MKESGLTLPAPIRHEVSYPALLYLSVPFSKHLVDYESVDQTDDSHASTRSVVCRQPCSMGGVSQFTALWARLLEHVGYRKTCWKHTADTYQVLYDRRRRRNQSPSNLSTPKNHSWMHLRLSLWWSWSISDTSVNHEGSCNIILLVSTCWRKFFPTWQ